jgi:hypothetical protein
MFYESTCPDVFWLWCRQYNQYEKFALLSLLREKHKHTKKMFKFDKTPIEHVGCLCIKYADMLKPIALELADVVRCLSHDPQICNRVEWSRSISIVYHDEIVTCDKPMKTYVSHIKLGQSQCRDIKSIPQVFDEHGKLTVFGLYVCLNSDKFDYNKLHKYLDIIDIYVIGLLLKYRRDLQVRGKTLIEPRRRFKLSPFGVGRFIRMSDK